MVAVPAVNPVITPLVAFTVATAVFELAQAPVAPVVKIEPIEEYVVAVVLQITEVPVIVPALFPCDTVTTTDLLTGVTQAPAPCAS